MQQQYQCPNCGAQVAFGVRSCGACGMQLNWQQQTPPPPVYQQPVNNQQQVPPYYQQHPSYPLQQQYRMNWLQRHLNWTTFLITVFIYLVLTFVVVVNGDSEGAFVNITAVLLFVASFFAYGWVLRRKSRSIWWLLLNWLAIGWIIYLALDNRTLKYTPTDRNNVLDLVRLWAHVMKSLDSVMPLHLAEKISLQQNSDVSHEEFNSTMSDTLTKVETVRSQLVDNYEWPVFTDMESNGIVAEIKSNMSNFFTCEVEGIELMRDGTYTQYSQFFVDRSVGKKLSKVTKKLNQLGEQMVYLLAKLVRRYRIPHEEYRQVVTNIWPDIDSLQIR